MLNTFCVQLLKFDEFFFKCCVITRACEVGAVFNRLNVGLTRILVMSRYQSILKTKKTMFYLFI